MKDTEEFDRAFARAREKHPGISRDLGYAFLAMLSARQRDDRSAHFPELIRLTLNELEIWSSDARAPYRALAGFFFGRRGGLVAAVRRKKQTTGTQPAATPPRTQKKRAPVRIIAEKSGQLAWKI